MAPPAKEQHPSSPAPEPVRAAEAGQRCFSRPATAAEAHEATVSQCDHDPSEAAPAIRPPGAGPGRRTFLKGMAAAVAAPVLLPTLRIPRASAATSSFIWNTAQPSIDGLLVSSSVIDQHIHGSGSEGTGSIGGSAAGNAVRSQTDGVTASLLSEHDWRDLKFAYRGGCDFVGQHDVDPLTKQVWGFKAITRNNIAQSAFGYGSASVPGVVVRAAQASPSAAAVSDVFIDATTGSTNLAFRGRLGGVVHSFVVTPESGGLDPAGNSWLEYSVALSSRPASSVAGQLVPAGPRSLTYRFVAPSTALLQGRTSAYVNQGAMGVVYIAVIPGQANQVTCDFNRDIAQCWNDMNPSTNGGSTLTVEDNGLLAMHWRAVAAAGTQAGGTFNQLRIDNSAYTTSMSSAIARVVAVATQFSPQGSVQVGTEVSGFTAHAGLYLPPGQDTQIVYPFELYPPNHVGGGANAAFWPTWLTDPTLVPPDALSVENHPFGSGTGAARAANTQLSTVQRMAYEKLMYKDANHALYCPLPWKALEVYPSRGRVSTYGHELYAMLLWSNGQFPVLVGASDNHTGAPRAQRFLTRSWVDPANPTAGYWDGLFHGRSWLAYMGQFSGTLDLQMGGDGLPDVYMGQIGVMSGVNRRPLQIMATDLPTGGRLDVLRTSITGAAFTPTFNSSTMAVTTQIIASYTATDLAGGAITLPVDTSSSSFGNFFHLRVSVPNPKSLEATGYSGRQVVALSNPIFHLQYESTNTAPGAPQAIPSWKTVVRL